MTIRDNWLTRLLLPYEFEDHPLHTPKYEEPDLSDWDEIGPYYTGGPNSFRKETEWVKYGDKFYKKFK